MKIPWKRIIATHPHILAWRIPWTEEAGGLQSIGLQRAGHSGSDLACTQAQGHYGSFSGGSEAKNPSAMQETCVHWVRKIPQKRKWQSTPVFLPRKSHGGLQSMGLQRVGPDWPHTHTHTHTHGKTEQFEAVYKGKFSGIYSLGWQDWRRVWNLRTWQFSQLFD